MIKTTLKAIALTLLAGAAYGQIGPDVITWRIAQYISGGEDINAYSAANGKKAYAFCTISCNIGDDVLLWESGGSVRHPVIAQNLFRLKSGRFEQLGQSFLKHGFCALSQSGCGACQATPCSTLGIGCADTYGAGLNDGAGGGRKSQVNSCRGDHVHPYSSPTGTDPNKGRLQVYLSEIDQALNNNASATYFIEGQYVAEDDQLAGNVANNASWRKVSVDSAENIHIISGNPTIVEPAIFAWRAENPAVVIEEVSNVDEGGLGVHGLFYAGYDVIDNNDGTWTYSYAIQNLSSDDAGYSFAVPVDNSAFVIDHWFTDVEWHSGEPYDNGDWTYQRVGGWVKWTCQQTYAQDADANALRWGTLFSFGFTADALPVTAMGEFTTFETNSILNVSLKGAGQGGGTGPIGVADCFGENLGLIHCPCGNPADAGSGEGCRNSTGSGALLSGYGSRGVANDNAELTMAQIAPNEFGIIVQGTANFPVAFYDGIWCAAGPGGTMVRLPVMQADGAGSMTTSFSLVTEGAPFVVPGATLLYQGWYRDPASPCAGANFSNMLQLTWW